MYRENPNYMSSRNIFEWEKEDDFEICEEEKREEYDSNSNWNINNRYQHSNLKK